MQQLPGDILQWFHDRGITDHTLEEFNIGWTGAHIKIPYEETYKLRRSPFTSEGAKYLNPKGNSTTLFKSRLQFRHDEPLIIAEGEMDVLRLHSAGYQACCSTGGAGTWKKEWLEKLDGCMAIYICYDYDSAGISGSFNCHEMIPGSLIVWLPSIVGEHGDITDFFQHLDKHVDNTVDNFNKFLQGATNYCLPTYFERQNCSKRDKISMVTNYIEYIMGLARAERCKIGRASRSDAPEQYLISLLNGLLGHLKRKPTARDHYSDETLESAKRMPITNFIEFRKDNTTNCIFHDEKTGSMHYYPNQNKVFCFGCRKSADVIDVIQQQRRCTLSEAIKIALGRTN